MSDLQLNLNDDQGINKLIYAINMFRAAYNYEPYIICSKETCKLIESVSFKEYTYDTSEYDTAKGRVGTYIGYKILIDNTLSFGEVKIR